MKTTTLVAALILVIVPAMVLGSPWSGGSNGNWENEPNETLSGTITLKVYQWCNIEFEYYYYKKLRVTDYDTPAEITAKPYDYIAALFNVRSNADLKLAMKGFRIYDATGSVVNYDQQYIKEKYWSLYQWSPSADDEKSTNVGERTIVDLNGTISNNDMFYLGRDERYLKYGDFRADFGVGLKIILDKAFPAGRYTFEYTIYVFPTVTLPSG